MDRLGVSGGGLSIWDQPRGHCWPTSLVFMWKEAVGSPARAQLVQPSGQRGKTCRWSGWSEPRRGPGLPGAGGLEGLSRGLCFLEMDVLLMPVSWARCTRRTVPIPNFTQIHEQFHSILSQADADFSLSPQQPHRGVGQDPLPSLLPSASKSLEVILLGRHLWGSRGHSAGFSEPKPGGEEGFQAGARIT